MDKQRVNLSINLRFIQEISIQYIVETQLVFSF